MYAVEKQMEEEYKECNRVGEPGTETLGKNSGKR